MLDLDSIKNNPWFAGTSLDEFNRTVIYVHYLNFDVIKALDVLDENVLVHFLSYKISSKFNYINIQNSVPSLEDSPNIDDEELDIDLLVNHLDFLETRYGFGAVQDVFFEIHDGENAVTNVSTTYPDLRESMDHLYKKFGFDIIYSELELD